MRYDDRSTQVSGRVCLCVVNVGRTRRSDRIRPGASGDDVDVDGAVAALDDCQSARRDPRRLDRCASTRQQPPSVVDADARRYVGVVAIRGDIDRAMGAASERAPAAGRRRRARATASDGEGIVRLLFVGLAIQHDQRPSSVRLQVVLSSLEMFDAMVRFSIASSSIVARSIADRRRDRRRASRVSLRQSRALWATSGGFDLNHFDVRSPTLSQSERREVEHDAAYVVIVAPFDIVKYATHSIMMAAAAASAAEFQQLTGGAIDDERVDDAESDSAKKTSSTTTTDDVGDASLDELRRLVSQVWASVFVGRY